MAKHMRYLSLLLLSLLLGSCDDSIEKTSKKKKKPSKQSGPPAIARAGASELIQVYFTTPDLVYPDVPAERETPLFEKAIIADIDNAKRRIDVATFEYNLESIKFALLRAKERGVNVRLALDKENLEKEEMSAWANALEDAGVSITWETSTAFLHSKFLLIDDSIVWTGSWNLTQNDTYRNNNNILRLRVPAIAENYRSEFSSFMGGLFGKKKQQETPKPLTIVSELELGNYFSPTDRTSREVIREIEKAKESVYFLAFSFTSDPIADAMVERHWAGVEIKGVFETRNAKGQGSELKRFKDLGLKVLEDGNCYTMHHKVIIIDDDTVIAGSYNFSKRAEETNDENLLIIRSKAVARQYTEEFDRVYAKAENPTQCGSRERADAKVDRE
jgi:phosphatidylserine/phosphatidylglycerophosphate/cardiolipin synthase-like enzyme